MTDLKIAIGSDHAGFSYKEALLKTLQVAQLKDFGTYGADSVDYPDFAHPVATAVENGDFDFGILICGSANGVAITANKHQGIRAAHLLERRTGQPGTQAQQCQYCLYPRTFCLV